MAKQLKWQTEYLEWLKHTTNEEVFEAYTDLAGGDDNDGCYTTRGNWEWGQLQHEIVTRLQKAKFLSEEYGK